LIFPDNEELENQVVNLKIAVRFLLPFLSPGKRQELGLRSGGVLADDAHEPVL
jgi:hypothetical protein